MTELLDIPIKPQVPDDIIPQWQRVVDITARIIDVPAGLIMKIHKEEMEVLISSSNEDNPWIKGDRTRLHTGLYCTKVLQTHSKLIIPNALSDPEWSSSPNVRQGMIAYMGVPIEWPDREIFGTICVLDNKENQFCPEYQDLIEQLRKLIESDLRMLCEVSCHRELSSQLQKLNRTLSVKNAELERFTHVVSHDLKSPAATIIGYTNRVQRALQKNRHEDVSGHIQYISLIARRMLNMVNDLLELSITGQSSGKPQEVSISEVIARWSADHEAVLSAKKIELVVYDNLPVIRIDPLRIAQVYDNLLGNALKYACQGPVRKIECGVKQTDTEIQLFVRDHGPGIPEKYHAEIFELFRRLSNDPTGTGVGLSIVRQVAEACNGRTWVESSPEEGSIFWVALPRDLLIER